MKKVIFVEILLAMILMATCVQAQNVTYRQLIEEFLESNIKSWTQKSIVIDSIKAQNTKHASLTQDDIERLDKQWRAELKSAERPLINKVLATPLSKFLKEIKDDNEGLFSEIFMMDNKGLNVGQSDVTSDYWQGDEDKWQKTFQAGSQALLIGDREFDNSTGKFLIQISLPLVDPASQEVIGAATIGVNVAQLMRTSVAAAMPE